MQKGGGPTDPGEEHIEGGISRESEPAIDLGGSNEIINIRNDGIKIPQLNIRGVKPKRNELISLLCARNIDIACIQETLLSSSINVNSPSYSLERADRPSIKKGSKNGGGGGAPSLFATALRTRSAQRLSIRGISRLNLRY